MAEIAAFLPKWQPQQMLCQIACQYGIGEKIIKDISLFFFLANGDIKCMLRA
jgi:hypothetical protein